MPVNGVSALAVAAAGGGLIFLWSGLHGASVTGSLRDLLSGRKPSGVNANPVSGGSVASGPVSAQGGNPGTVSAKANQATGRLMAGAYGWSAGAEWTALDNIVMAESGWDSTAQNPTSTAYGIFQFLDTTWASVGYAKTSDPVTQIAAGLKYIKQRYGDPVAAWQFHLANGWY